MAEVIQRSRSSNGPSSSEALQAQLDAAQSKLKNIEERSRSCDNDSEEHLVSQPQPPLSVAARLTNAQVQVWEVELSQKLLDWSRDRTSCDSIIEDARACVALGDLLRTSVPDHSNIISHSLFRGSEIWMSALQEYQELHDYCKGQLILTLRRTLSSHKYPEPKSTKGLLRLLRDPHSTLTTTSRGLFQLHDSYRVLVQQRVLLIVEGGSLNDDAVLLEWMRPLTERVRYHFIEPNAKKPLKVDRLPLLICSYLQETLEPIWKIHVYLNDHIAPGASSDGGGDDWTVNVLNYAVRLLQSVLVHHEFFRHQSVAGSSSKPNILAQAVEHLLRFDAFTRQLLTSAAKEQHCAHSLRASTSPPLRRLMSVVDAQVASDTNLLDWWLDRERERSLGLLSDTAMDENGNAPEVFGSLVHSIQTKASLVFGGPYIRHVLSPLCVQFLDQIHEEATDLRQLLVQKPIENLQDSVICWLQLFQGVADCRMQLQTTTLEVGRDDVLRFADSLAQWEQVWTDTLTSLIVETILMERCKLAQYLLQCSHLLSSPDADVQVTLDLSEAREVFVAFGNACRASANANGLRDAVYKSVAHEFIAICLNHDGMTPFLYPQGAAALHNDLQDLFGDEALPPECLQLLEMVELASKETGLSDALFALTGDWSLEAFGRDSRVVDEAVSMVRAKGIVWIELPEILNVLSRRGG